MKKSLLLVLHFCCFCVFRAEKQKIVLLQLKQKNNEKDIM